MNEASGTTPQLTDAEILAAALATGRSERLPHSTGEFPMTDSSSPSIHRIRLQGPWEWAVPTPISTQAWTWNRVRLPDEWDRLPTMPGPVWFRRRFRTPTGIHPGDGIFIEIPSVQQTMRVILNGQNLEAILIQRTDSEPVTRCDITRDLIERNLLEIVFSEGMKLPDSDCGLGRPVVLAIESQSPSN